MSKVSSWNKPPRTAQNIIIPCSSHRSRPVSRSSSTNASKAASLSPQSKHIQLHTSAPSTAKTAPTNDRRFEDLPLEVQKICKNSKIVEPDMDVLWPICEFLFSKHFTDFHFKHKLFYEPTCDSNFSKQSVTQYKKLGDPNKQFKNIEADAKGGFGKIFKARLKGGGGLNVAIKKLPNNSPKERERNACEVGLLSSLKHPSIVSYHCTFHSAAPQQEEIWVVMEYIEGGMLSQAAKTKKIYDLQIAFIARELLEALNYLHDQGIGHRDIKPSNIMLSTNGHVKLIDFGLAAFFTHGTRIDVCGTPTYMAPEMIIQSEYGLSVDLWSLGVCLLELAVLWQADEAKQGKGGWFYDRNLERPDLYIMYKTVIEGLDDVVDELPEQCFSMAKKFLKKILDKDPKERGSPADLLEMPWVNQESMDIGYRHLVKQIFVTKSFDSFLI